MEAKRITTDTDLELAFKIRKAVFVKEQGVPLEAEFDDFDTLSDQWDHILVYYNGQAVGTGRLRPCHGLGKLERICILKPYRKFGLGRIVISSLEELAQEKGFAQVKLHGQTQAEGFYNRLGYQTSSEIFMEDGIPHVLMIKEIY